MTDEEKSKKSEKVEIKYKDNADEKTKIVASQLDEIFNGPLFARMVRNAVEEMILEGKLTYDIETDTIDVPEDIVKKWAARMEKEVWSKGSSGSQEGGDDDPEGDDGS